MITLIPEKHLQKGRVMFPQQPAMLGPLSTIKKKKKERIGERDRHEGQSGIKQEGISSNN